jgi:hypothetical protein
MRGFEAERSIGQVRMRQLCHIAWRLQAPSLQRLVFSPKSKVGLSAELVHSKRKSDEIGNFQAAHALHQLEGPLARLFNDKLQSTRPGFLIVTRHNKYVLAVQVNHVLDVLDYQYLDQRMRQFAETHLPVLLHKLFSDL